MHTPFRLLLLAGAAYPASHDGKDILPLDGISLAPIFLGNPEARTPHQTLGWHWNGNRALREGDTKIAWDSKLKRWELYDLALDRTETNDLAAQHPEKVQELAAQWEEWAERTGVR